LEDADINDDYEVTAPGKDTKAFVSLSVLGCSNPACSERKTVVNNCSEVQGAHFPELFSPPRIDTYVRDALKGVFSFGTFLKLFDVFLQNE
jgi:hypothetical protein